MERFKISAGKLTDAAEIASLYRMVAAIEGGLARTEDEIDEEYVAHFVFKSVESGIIVVARNLETCEVIGEIHAYALGPKVFAHVLGELTIAVHPGHQGMGVGRELFTELMRRVIAEHPEILRVELIARESNEKAIKFYEKIGFEIEGLMKCRIRSVGGGFESDIPMAWHRPVP